MRIAIIGGTFNPIHNGHLYLASEVQWQFSCDLVLFVPAFMPVHKETAELIEAGHRLRMLRGALSGTDYEVDDCEIRRGGKSYTIETVDYVEKNYPVEGKIVVVIGDDLIAGFRDWREAEQLAARSDLIVAHRQSSDEIPFAYPHRYCNNLLFPVSSRDIRMRIREGRPYRFFLPESVYGYIREMGLYRT